MPSIFSRIVNGELPCHRIAEEQRYMAFLDVMPLEKGHTLVIPKKETDYIFDLEPEEYNGLWIFSRKIAAAIGNSVPCKRVGIAVIGLEVPHAHIHLIPLNSGTINFSLPKLKLAEKEMQEIAAKIRKAYSLL
ncbi:MAG: HIT family protein [Bacteroidia bacterium]|nr:HIT family protein [Bacteroidia bacterium]